MDKLRAARRTVETLSPQELRRFRRWFAEFDYESWSDELQADAEVGRFDGLAGEALAGFASVRHREI